MVAYIFRCGFGFRREIQIGPKSFMGSGHYIDNDLLRFEITLFCY